MPHPRRAARLYAALALCAALVLAFLGGMLTERMRFDRATGARCWSGWTRPAARTTSG
jgi:hypothetical protein